MSLIKKRVFSFLLISLICFSVKAGDVTIIAAEFKQQESAYWNVKVTLLHDDAGWAHYADSWRIVDSLGTEFGERVLLHPHENEQPFTRSLNRVKIPQETTLVFIEAHDKLHGYAPVKLKIDLSLAVDGYIKIKP